MPKNNNETIDLITSRRSIRSFLKKKIPKGYLRQIITAGLSAPSSKNSMPWFFVVVGGKHKDQIAKWIIERINGSTADRRPVSAKSGKSESFDSTMESIRTITEAGALILVFNRAPFSKGNRNVILHPRGGRSLFTYACEIIGLGASVQNMLLAAHSLGLGAVYMADSYPAREAIEHYLKTDREMLGTIAIGYPNSTPSPRKINKTLVLSWEKAVGEIDKHLEKHFKINYLK